MWGSRVDMVVGMRSSLWGCLGLNLDVQLCDGILDCIVVQPAIDGDRAWSLMGESTGVSWRAIGREVWILWLGCDGVGALSRDGWIISFQGQLEGQGYG